MTAHLHRTGDPAHWTHDDGGRAAAGFKGEAGDCVTRAIAIAASKPYGEVYDDLHDRMRAAKESSSQLDRLRAGKSPRNGVHRRIYERYLADLGWTWTPTMHVGSGCKVHLRSDELPPGRLIVRLSRHLCAVIDGVIHDTHDPSRDGTRCVYGYWALDGGEQRG